MKPTARILSWSDDMRKSLILLITAAAAMLAACDQAISPGVAGLGSTTTGQSTSTGGTTALAIVPNRIQLAAGATFQLSTNAPSNLQSRVQWSSQQSTVAAVSPTGLVSAISAGTATIIARYSFDTTRAATAVVTVTGTTTSTGAIGSGGM